MRCWPPSDGRGYGLTFDGAALHLDLAMIAASGLIWGGTALGAGAAVFAIWGTGGAAGLRRVMVYVLSPIPPLIAASGAGWGITESSGVISIQIETLLTAYFAGSGLSLGIFRRWGVK